MNYGQLRRVISILLFFVSITMFVTGAILYLKTTNVLYKLVEWVPTKNVDVLHIYVGFAMSGLALIHIYLNWPVLKGYFKPRKR